MEPTAKPQISLTMMLALVACIAVNFWLFRVGIFWGMIALYITKHVVIAAFCQMVGLNREPDVVPVPEKIGRGEPSSS
jgi:hypothetical protein